MKYRKLGRTDLDVSVIGLGTMTWGRQNTQEEGHEQMDYAFERGVNFFDTAEAYAIPPTAETTGKTEEIIGNWFTDRNNRDQVILASKVAGAGFPWIRGGENSIDGNNIVEAVEGSLKRLKTEYIDLYQLHWPNREHYNFSNKWTFSAERLDKEAEEANFVEVLETLDRLVKSGKIRYAGLSNETSWGTMKYLQISEKQGLPRVVSIQNEYSLLNRVFDWDLAEVSIAENVGLLAYSPLAGGMLSGKYLGGKRPEGARWSLGNRYIYRDTKWANAAVSDYIDIAKKHALDVCQMALAFVNERPFVTSNLIGATTMEQLKVNIESIDITLSDEVLSDIEEVRRAYPVPY